MRKFLMLAGAMLIGLAAQAAPGDVFLLQIPDINGTVNFPLPITLAALGGGNEHELLRFVLKNAVVTSVLFGGDSVTSSCTETLTISAEQIQISSTPQLADGAPGATSTTEIDCQAGKIQ